MAAPTEIALFAGAGGGCMASVLMRHRIVCYVENNGYCVDVLRARIADGMLDDAPIWDDVRTFDGRPWRGLVDIITAGFPCQGFSTASRGRPRQRDLWPYAFRAIEAVEPRHVFAENVQRGPIERAAADLGRIGYVARCARVSAAAVGAPHKRPRFWMVADLDRQSQRPGAVDAEVACLPPTVGARQWAKTPGRVLGMDAGCSHRMDRLKALGNGQVPSVARLAWRLLN